MSDGITMTGGITVEMVFMMGIAGEIMIVREGTMGAGVGAIDTPPSPPPPRRFLRTR
jgi:hypothetical protein